jgi:hypothetical protein
MTEKYKIPLFRKILNKIIPNIEFDFKTIELWYQKKYQAQIPQKPAKYIKLILKDIYKYNDMDRLGKFLFSTMLKQQLINIHYVLKSNRTKKLPPILFILSLPRTGSTFLHTAFCKNYDVSSLSFWEQNHIGNYRFRIFKKLEGTLMLFMQDILTPELKYIHKVSNNGPEEGSKILLSSFITQIYPLMFKLPNYYEKLKNEDYEFTYYFFKKSLELMKIDNQRPLVLKAPMHLQSIDQLIHNFPQAKFVFLHRDLKKVIPSAISLAMAYNRLFHQSFDTIYLKEKLIEKLSNDLQKTIDHITQNNMNVINIEYQKLVKEPLHTFNRIAKTMNITERQSIHLDQDKKFKKHIYQTINFDMAKFKFYIDYLESEGLGKNL